MKERKNHFRSVVSLVNTKLSVKTAAIVIASSTLISALLGIFRDRWLNSMYYDTYPAGLDAYTAAFTVPDFLFFIKPVTIYSGRKVLIVVAEQYRLDGFTISLKRPNQFPCIYIP